LKPKNLIILACFALLVLAAGILHFGQQQTQAAAQNRVTVVHQDAPPAIENPDNLIPVWMVRGTMPTGGYISCSVAYPDGRVETIPLDGRYELGDRYHFLVSLFPASRDWGATVRLTYRSLDESAAWADREILLEKVAPQLPADRPGDGFVWRGEELPGCNVWLWEVNL